MPRFSKPDNDTFALSMYVAFQVNLVFTLLTMFLIDVDSINPHESEFFR